MTAYQNARCYWEMYGGLPPETTDRYIHALDIWLDIGGHKAADYPDYYQVSVYGRKTVDSPNIVTIYQEAINGTSTWRHVHIAEENTDNDVRCIVLRVEAKVETVPATTTTYVKGYDDQYDTADTPPWGVRITDYAVYCTSLHRDIRLHRVLDDIIDNRGFAYSGPVIDWEPDQLAFTDVPKDRWDGLDEINGMLGYNYHCWSGTDVVFSAPKSGTAYEIDAGDPRTTWSVERGIDETYNCVRVCYTNARGKPREVIMYADESPLGFTRADTLNAPESIKSKKMATKFGERYLAAHSTVQVAGSLSITGDDGVLDPLLIRPGDTVKMTGAARFLTGTHEVTRVTLRPLDWTADLEFGNNSKRFDRWLARLAAGGRHITRR
jgi:hypothetical protein